MGRKRCSRVTRLRKYSTLKRYPKRPKVIIKEDLGDAELVDTITFPQVEHVKTVIPKEKNPDLVYITKNPIRIAFYTNKGVAYIYDDENRFLGTVDIHELWVWSRHIEEALARYSSKNKLSGTE